MFFQFPSECLEHFSQRLELANSQSLWEKTEGQSGRRQRTGRNSCRRSAPAREEDSLPFFRLALPIDLKMKSAIFYSTPPSATRQFESPVPHDPSTLERSLRLTSPEMLAARSNSGRRPSGQVGSVIFSESSPVHCIQRPSELPKTATRLGPPLRTSSRSPNLGVLAQPGVLFLYIRSLALECQ